MLKNFFIALALIMIVMTQLFIINPLFSLPAPSLVLTFILALPWLIEEKEVYAVALFMGLVYDVLTFQKIGCHILFFPFLVFLLMWFKRKFFWDQRKSNGFLMTIIVIGFYFLSVFFDIAISADQQQIFFLLQKFQKISFPYLGFLAILNIIFFFGWKLFLEKIMIFFSGYSKNNLLVP